MAKLNGVKTLDMVNGEITKIAYDGAEYVADGKLDGGKTDVGNLLQYNGGGGRDVTEGAFYEVKYNRNDAIYDDVEDNPYLPENMDFTIFRKVSESSSTLEERVSALESEVSALKGEAPATITFEGAEYRKVDREAREGDVIIQNAETGSLIVKQGVPHKVEMNGSCSRLPVNNRDLYNAQTGRTRETVDVYELVAKEQAPYEPKVGDIVVVTDIVGSNNVQRGDIGVVRETDGGIVRVNPPGKIDKGNWLMAHKIRPATAEEIAAYEKAQAATNKPKLKAGDFVKITRRRSYYDNDKVYEVFKDINGDLYVIDEEDHPVYGAIRAEEYEIVDAETAKWAKLGRKVTEYKKGDIVRAETLSLPSKDINGHIGVVEDVGLNLVGIRFKNGRYCGAKTADGNVELIAPVDARFDK